MVGPEGQLREGLAAVGIPWPVVLVLVRHGDVGERG